MRKAEGCDEFVQQLLIVMSSMHLRSCMFAASASASGSSNCVLRMEEAAKRLLPRSVHHDCFLFGEPASDGGMFADSEPTFMPPVGISVDVVLCVVHVELAGRGN